MADAPSRMHGRRLPAAAAGQAVWQLAAAAALGGAVGIAGEWSVRAAGAAAVVAVGVAAVRQPVVGLTVLVAGYLTGGLQEHLTGVPELLVWRDVLLAVLLLRTAVARRLTFAPRTALAVSLLWGAYLLALAVLRDLPTAATLQGARLLLTGPVVLMVAAAWVTTDDLQRMLTWLTPVLALSVTMAVWQARSDVATLLAAGYEYGTTVRHAGGHIRAFGALDHGLMFGHAMAVLLVVYATVGWTSRGWSDVTGPRRLALAAGAALAATGLALSLTRTAIIGAVVAMVAVCLTGAARASWRAAVAVCAVVLIGLTAMVSVRGGAMFTRLLDGEDASLTARIDSWTSLRDDPDGDLVVGAGPGTAGAVAQIVDTGTDRPTVTDSWYAAVLVQYGVVGAAGLIAFLALLAARLPPRRIRTSPAAAAAAGILIHFAVTMATYNIWEELAAAVPAFAVIGAGVAGSAHMAARTSAPPPMVGTGGAA